MALILGIETSCDETSAAVIEDGRRLLSNIVLSQVPIHRLYGGVVPELASREHLRAIVPVVRQALEAAGKSIGDIDAVAVTHGPGLAGALLVGLTYAKALSQAAGKPLIGVNHLAGHLHAVFLEERRHARPDPALPAVALVVSGGHTQLYRLELGAAGYRYHLLGQTRDDAAGEAYDKVAKLLGLGYPGGPLIDRLAALGDPDAVSLGRIRLKGNPLDFSFSGIKTAVLRQVQKSGLQAAIDRRRAAVTALGHTPSRDEWASLCEPSTLNLIAAFQQAVVSDLTERTLAALDRAAESGQPARSLLLTGGVAANSALRRSLAAGAERLGLPLFAPALSLCTDNAAMIAAAAEPLYQRAAWSDASLAAFAQLPLDRVS